MVRIIREGDTPSIFALHYDPIDWAVEDLLLIPRFVISPSFLVPGKPTLPKGRKRPWVGCNFALDRIPTDAKIPVVVGGIPRPHSHVRERFERLSPLQRQRWYNRGWTMDVLKIVRSLGKREFQLAELYDQANDLRLLHPANRNVEAKIRQQLQRLRDLKFLDFLAPGRYRLRH